MATITAIRSGNWSDPNIWDLERIPQDMDDVVISNGCIVVYDFDMSDDNQFPNGVNTIYLNGSSAFTKLVVHRTRNTYLKFYSSIRGGNGFYNWFDWGKVDDPVLADKCVIEKRGANAYVGGNYAHPTITFYGKDPGVVKSSLTADASAGSNVIYVDVSFGFSLNVGDEIFLEGITNDKSQVEFHTVASFNPSTGEVVLRNNLAYNKQKGARVWKLTRNVLLLSKLSSGSRFLYTIAPWQVSKWGCFQLKDENFVISNIVDSVSFFTFEKAVFITNHMWAFNYNVFVDSFIYCNDFQSINNVLQTSCLVGHAGWGGNSYESEIINCSSTVVWQCVNSRVKATEIDFRNCSYVNTQISTDYGWSIYFSNQKGFLRSDIDYFDFLTSKVMSREAQVEYSHIVQMGKNIFNFVNVAGWQRWSNGILEMNFPWTGEWVNQWYYWNDEGGLWWNWYIRIDVETEPVQYTRKIKVKKTRSLTNEYIRPQIRVFKGKLEIGGIKTRRLLQMSELSNLLIQHIVMPDTTNEWVELTVDFTATETSEYTIQIFAGKTFEENNYSVYWEVNPLDENFFSILKEKEIYFVQSMDVLDISDVYEIIEI
jgi:hypothetical protein